MATPTCAMANRSCRRPPQPSSETSRTIPSGNTERWRNSPAGGWAPGLRHPLARGIRTAHVRGWEGDNAEEGVPSESGTIWFACGRGPAAATAPAGPERHWRKRQGPSASDGLGNRGAILGLPCTDREHGGTRAVSRRSGSPREPRSEGSAGAAPFAHSAMAMRSRTGGWV